MALSKINVSEIVINWNIANWANWIVTLDANWKLPVQWPVSNQKHNGKI